MRGNHDRIATTAVAALLAFSLPALAQQQGGSAARPQQPAQGQQAQARSDGERQGNLLVIMPSGLEARLPEGARARPVTAEQLQRGMSARRLLDQDVYGAAGDELGEVQDIFIGTDGRVTAIVVEGGGFLDIGDAAFRIPWNEVDLTPGVEGIRVQLTEENAERRDLFDGPETVMTGPREYRVSELIGDYVRLRSGEGFGRVSDVVIGEDGRVTGVVGMRGAGLGGGLFGYPYYGYSYGFDPGLSYYALPFATVEEASQAPRIDRERLDQGVL